MAAVRGPVTAKAITDALEDMERAYFDGRSYYKDLDRYPLEVARYLAESIGLTLEAL